LENCRKGSMIRFGLLGCGLIAKRHSELLGGNHIDRASLVSIYDPNCARRRHRLKFGIPAHYDIDDFLARQNIDGVAVLTRSGLHRAHVIACARAGKHVVEKPMALRLQDADANIPRCHADRKGEDDRCLTTLNVETDRSAKHRPSDRVSANAHYTRAEKRLPLVQLFRSLWASYDGLHVRPVGAHGHRADIAPPDSSHRRSGRNRRRGRGIGLSGGEGDYMAGAVGGSRAFHC
jgi:hypothetical protein